MFKLLSIKVNHGFCLFRHTSVLGKTALIYGTWSHFLVIHYQVKTTGDPNTTHQPQYLVCLKIPFYSQTASKIVVLLNLWCSHILKCLFTFSLYFFTDTRQTTQYNQCNQYETSNKQCNRYH